LETISLKCLEKLAQHRYPSAEALADDLRRYLEGKPILARPAGRIERVVKWGRRRPAAAALAAVSTIALMIVVALASWYQLQVNKNYRLAKANLRQAQNAIDQLINRVSIEGLAPVPRSENLRRELLEAALSFCLTLQEQNPNDRELMRQTVRAQRQMADLYQMLDRQEAALSAYRRAIAAGSTAVARFRQVEDRRELAVACNNMANLLARNDQTVASEGAYQQSVAIWEQLQRQWPNQRDYSRGLAAAKNNLALLWASAGKLVAARHAAEEAIAIRRSLATIDRQASAYQLELATSLNNLATIHKASGQYAAADPLLRQARDLLAQQQPSVAKLPTARFTLASIENNLATVLAAEHEAGQSEQAYRRAIELLEPLASEFPAIGTYRQALADARSNFGLLLAAQGRTADAEDELRGAEQLYAKLSADAPTAVAIRLGQMLTLSRRADVAAREGRSGEAERLIVAAAKLGDALLKEAPRNADVAAAQSLALQTMSRLLVDRRLLDRARGTLEQAREIARQAVENNPHAGSSRMSLIGANTSLAKLLIELGEPADASRIAEENVALAAAGPEQVLDTVHLLAQCVPLALAIKGKGQALREGVPLDEYCARRALELLTALKRQGRDLTALADDPAMAVFKDRPEFRELFGEPAAGP
jgi:tetratricopeptide (TPR) repeat protein